MRLHTELLEAARAAIPMSLNGPLDIILMKHLQFGLQRICGVSAACISLFVRAFHARIFLQCKIIRNSLPFVRG